MVYPATPTPPRIIMRVIHCQVDETGMRKLESERKPQCVIDAPSPLQGLMGANQASAASN